MERENKHKNDRLPIFTERFRKLQGERSNTEFADFLGISRQTVGFYCNGDRVPDALTLVKIAQTCGVSADWLLGLSEVKTFDIDLQKVCRFTKLSEEAVKFLKYIADNPEEPKSDMLPLVLSLILENYRFFQVLGGVALACSLEAQYDGPGDIEMIERFSNDHHEELKQIGASVWATGATSDMFLSQAVYRFMDCVKEVRYQFSGNSQQ